MTTRIFSTPNDIATSMAAQWPNLVDPGRLDKAIALVAFHAFGMAKTDESGSPISPSWEILEVRGTAKKPYIVRKGSCTCPDSTLGKKVCKHRLAFFIFKKLMEENYVN